MTHQVLIASYHKDFPFLLHCLRSLKRFSKGFLPPVIVVHENDVHGARQVVSQSFPEDEVAIFNGEPGMGFLRAQMAMMMGDVLCPRADYTWLLGSDCFVTDTLTPEPFFKDGKPVMLYIPYSDAGPAICWQWGTQRALGFRPDFEFMRRLPLIYPKGLFSPARKHIADLHGRPFEDYVKTRFAGSTGAGDFSESNILGAYAFKYQPDEYAWVSGAEWMSWPSPVLQFWSRHPAGLDGKIDHGFVLNGKSVFGRSPRSVIDEVLG